MAKYVDGFVIPIKKENLPAYRKMAKLGCEVWKAHGALDYYECFGDDLNTHCGVTFAKMCKLKEDETVVFAFIVYKSKADRNRINKLVMKDPRMGSMDINKMPFDLKRFSMAGFTVAVSDK